MGTEDHLPDFEGAVRAATWRGESCSGRMPALQRHFTSNLCIQVVVDRPDMVRCSCLLKRLAVTDLKADVSRLPKKGELTKAYEGMSGPCLQPSPATSTYSAGTVNSSSCCRTWWRGVCDFR